MPRPQLSTPISSAPPRPVQTLWHLFKSTGADNHRRQLLLQYMPLLTSITKRIEPKLPPEFDVKDLMAPAIVALNDALENFDFSCGVSFETYCSARIHGAVLRELHLMIRSMDQVLHLDRLRKNARPQHRRISPHQRAAVRQFVLRRLSHDERLIVVLYFYEQMSVKEIGVTLNLSESRVSRMLTTIIDQLKCQVPSGASTGETA